jgi:diguanylate cyclase (GGDEF)-like protein
MKPRNSTCESSGSSIATACRSSRGIQQVTGPTPIPPPIVFDPRTAGAAGAAIVCALLLLQYAHRRKPFILAWSTGWLLITPAFLIVSPAYTNARVAAMAVGVSQFLRICSVLFFLWSADLYRESRYITRWRVRWLAPLAVWFVLAPLALGTRTVLAPGFLINAIVLVAAASMYVAVLVERRMIGAGLTALVLLGLAITNVTSAFTQSAAPGNIQSASDIFLVNAALSMLAAVGIHLLVFEDMTYELRVTNRRLETAREELLLAATTDPLTGCHNRRFLEQVMGRELQRHERFGLPLSMLFIDVDRFKAVNDTLGHEAGDRVLQYVARFLKRHIREADYVFRWGGDEFLVLITCAAEEAQQKAAALKAAFDSAPEAIELPPGIGLSVGWAEVPPGTTDMHVLVREADARMYQDKGARPPRAATAVPAPGRQRRRK